MHKKQQEQRQGQDLVGRFWWGAPLYSSYVSVDGMSNKECKVEGVIESGWFHMTMGSFLQDKQVGIQDASWVHELWVRDCINSPGHKGKVTNITCDFI